MNDRATELLAAYQKVVVRFERNNEATIPFCAAEPIVSDFTKVPLKSNFSDRYLRSGVRAFDQDRDFIGTEFLFPLYKVISQACSTLFAVSYADARPLSGMNAALTVLMSLTSIGDRVLLLSPDAGGHESFLAICTRLGLDFEYIPFDLAAPSYDVDRLNALLRTQEYAAVIFPPSDLIFPPPIEEMDVPATTRIIYDCTQSFGLIAAGYHANPLASPNDVVLLGGTHKTLPGPTCGLVMANNEKTADLLESSITPSFVRNPQPHHVASLALTLIEFIEHGSAFMGQVISNANFLAAALEERGFVVKKLPQNNRWRYTLTHQIFLSMTPEEASTLHRSCRRLNISLDQKDKKMYGPAGVRLGVQAVTRLGWGEDELVTFADLLAAINAGQDDATLRQQFDLLRGKQKCLFAADANVHESLRTEAPWSGHETDRGRVRDQGA